MSPAVAEAIRVLSKKEVEVVHLTQKFTAKTADLIWIPALAEEGDWIVISSDPRITRNKYEKAAWEESGLTGYFFVSGFSDKGLWPQAAEAVRWWPTILESAKKAPTGSGFLLPFKGKEPQRIFPKL